MNVEGNYVNMLNETVNYKKWARSEPNNKYFSYGADDDVDCVMISLEFWFVTSCSWTLPALCSKRHSIGKYLECQFMEAGWLTNHPSDLPNQIKCHISDHKLIFTLE